MKPEESKAFKGTISELIEHLGNCIDSWSDYDKAVFRAGLTGKLSSDKSERIQ